MGKVALRGGSAGAVIGILVSQLIGLAVIGTDDIPSFADREDLPVMYVIAAVIGAVVGFVVGLAGLAVGRGVADATTGSPARRRLRGALAAGLASGALSLFTVSPLLSARSLIALVVLAVVGAVAAWVLLPGVVDLGTPPTPRHESPARPVVAVVVEAPSTPRRVLVTLAGALVGAFLGAQVLMTIVGDLTSLGRTTYDVVSFVVLGVLLVVIGAVLWRATGRSARRSRPTA
ncbi:hypothetical protein [Aeromicrobium chenweiae]|uniref:Uncharacterized protein n=1 Tax=Aeromicrobium chenweiae TaxID=2079793 RepID=A0A2S0WJE5_9ACTN|nr:hypothetical protein [Aeromicrobium chenweiae]AWB91412.1 hypothetical protein C3E78_03805 [Aeromicrobium chenweiae]TGN30656.1 hypothetical protein E4L97_16330 [Aeromicrobium chenweiae]